MTAPLDLDLARAAVALPGWQWPLGSMWRRDPTGAPDDDGDQGRVNDFTADAGVPDGAYPCVEDPCTSGGLLHLLGRDAWRVQCIVLADGDYCWANVVGGPFEQQIFSALRTPHLGEACIHAAIACGGWGRRC